MSAQRVVDAATKVRDIDPPGVPPGEPVEAAEQVTVLKVVPQNVLAVATVLTFNSTEVV